MDVSVHRLLDFSASVNLLYSTLVAYDDGLPANCFTYHALDGAELTIDDSFDLLFTELTATDNHRLACRPYLEAGRFAMYGADVSGKLDHQLTCNVHAVRYKNRKAAYDRLLFEYCKAD